MSRHPVNRTRFASTHVVAQQVEMALKFVGLSAQGAHQLALGEPVSSIADRMAIARLIQDFEVENDETHWVGHDIIARNPAGFAGDVTAHGRLAKKLLKAGLAPRGVHECLAGLPIINLEDRLAVAALVHRLFERGPVNPQQFGTYDPVEH